MHPLDRAKQGTATQDGRDEGHATCSGGGDRRGSTRRKNFSLNNNNNSNRNNNRRRGRGNRQQGGGNQNRIDSRARGNAPQMLDKYRKLAQDAQHNGDRVQAEYYLQFADHYFRVIADSRPRPDEQQQQRGGRREEQDFSNEEDGDEDEFGGAPRTGRDGSTHSFRPLCRRPGSRNSGMYCRLPGR